jgi:hypothetical protein
MAVSEMNAVRTWPRNRNSTTATSTAPEPQRAQAMLVSAVLDEVRRPVQPVEQLDAFAPPAPAAAPPARPRRRRVTSSVFAPYWLDIVSSTPGCPCTNASPNFGSAASTTEGHIFQPHAARRSCRAITASPSSAGSS